MVVRRRKRKKRVISWVDPDVGYGLAKRPKPARYRDPGVLSPAFKARLVVGALVTAKAPLTRVPPSLVESYPLPVLVDQRPRGPVVLPAGTSLIYAGTVRVRSRARINGEWTDMQVPKHTFVAPNLGRVIIHDLSLIRFA
jgi:hypothetical protein